MLGECMYLHGSDFIENLSGCKENHDSSLAVTSVCVHLLYVTSVCVHLLYVIYWIVIVISYFNSALTK